MQLALVPAVLVVSTVLVGLSHFGVELSTVQQCALGIIFGAGFFAIVAIGESRKELKAVPIPPKPTFKPREFTLEELAWYDGIKNAKAARGTNGRGPGEHPLPEYDGLIFVGVKGNVYSVSEEWYGPESPYHVFVGKDSSRHLGKVVVGDTEANCDWSGMARDHLKSLDEWEAKFKDKYEVVGTVKFGPDFKTKAAQFEP